MKDLIERQVAIEGVKKSCLGVGNVVQAEANAIEYIKRMPSAQPERYWIDSEGKISALPSAQPNVYVSTKEADYISRAQALNAINVGGDLEGAWINVAKLPSEQPEIIRCKDCIYFDKYTDGIEKYQWDGFCAHWARTTYENWYCSRAERRSDE